MLAQYYDALIKNYIESHELIERKLITDWIVLTFFKPFAHAPIVVTTMFLSLFNAHAAPACKGHVNFPVVDFSFSVTDLGKKGGKEGLDVLKSWGVKTIFRYYDQPKETLACKTLTPRETDILIENGFNIAVVYQHNSPDPKRYFQKGSGTLAARRALSLARANGQPSGSAIYFGVDGPDQRLASGAWMYSLANGKDYVRGTKHYEKVRNGRSHKRMQREIRIYNSFRSYAPKWFKQRNGKPLDPRDVRPHMLLPFLDTYFEEINREFSKVKDNKGRPRYRVGAYGSGLICSHLLGTQPVKPAALKPNSRLRGKGAKIDFCWLGQARGWPGTREFAKTSLWALDQEGVTRCSNWKRRSGGVTDFDFDRVQTNLTDFGQWNKVENRDLTDYVKPIPRKYRGKPSSCYKN